MDEVVGDGVAEHVDDTQLCIKEHEFSLKPGSSDMLQSDEMVTPGVGDYLVTNLDRIGSSDHASSSPRCMDEEVMVEELTLKSYDGEKLTIVGTSENRERMKTRRSPWQHLYQISGGQMRNREKGQVASGVVEDGNKDGDNNFFSELLDQNQPQPDNRNESINTNDKGTPGNTCSSGGVRSKILSKSGFSEYFIKSTLRGKGEIHKIPASRGPGAETRNLVHSKIGLAKSDAQLDVAAQTLPFSPGVSEPRASLNINNAGNGTSLREWLGGGRYKANKEQSLHIFRQVLDLVDLSHSHGVPLQDLRPSCFKLLGSHKVVYTGSLVHSNVKENVNDQDTHQLSYSLSEKRPLSRSMRTPETHSAKKRNLGENTSISRRWPQFPSRSGVKSASNNTSNDVDGERNHKTESKSHIISSGHSMPSLLQQSQASVSFMLEEKWYSSPELFDEKRCTFASNIYCLGVILFELLDSFDSGRSHAAAMQDLRHRILPPRFLSANPKEAGFCLWLFHPEPSLRPTTREILQSEFISGIQEVPGDESPVSMDEEDENSELLLYFLLALNEQKQKDASHLVEQIHRIEADIQEVGKRRPKKLPSLTSSSQESLNARGKDYMEEGNTSLDVLSKMSPTRDKELRLMSNMKQLESAYFSMRSDIQTSSSDNAAYRDRELLKSRENLWSTGKEEKKYGAGDKLGSFFDGLCKYARYRKLRVRGISRNGEFNNTANVICSLSFDRDENYLAAGGVSKKIKVFEYEALFNDSVDIHYPVVEMANKSKLSCICWNSYIRNYLASTDYDGIVKLWDASTGQGFCNFSEHSARAWSVDFSRVDPMKLASGSDDRMVKIWSINDKNSLCTIRNNANVCCVQFSDESSHLLAFSSADYKIYCYDLRNASVPWCVLAGHEKTVSYAKFLDGGTVVSASTDNTLKIWDLSKTSSNSLSRDACVSTLRGHTNEKNFVGLSVADGYISCGSETNEVFAYYKSLPMPITAHKFGSIDPITGKETEDDNGQFVSSVCWRRKSNMVVAANSSGCIKLLEMI